MDQEDCTKFNCACCEDGSSGPQLQLERLIANICYLLGSSLSLSLSLFFAPLVTTFKVVLLPPNGVETSR